MNKLFALLPLFIVQLAHAQDYKELKKEDIQIVMSDDKRSVTIDVLTKDSKALPAGYYTAPFNKLNNKISFYVGPNGKLSKTAKLVDAEVYFLIPLENSKAHGKASVFKNDKLIKEIVYESGIIRSSREFDRNKRADEAHDAIGVLVSRKEYEDNVLVSETQFINGGSVEKQYKNGKVFSSHDSKTDQYFTYYPNGEIATASDVVNGKKVDREFNINGTLTSEKTTSYQPFGITTRWFYLDGKLRKIEEESSIHIKFKEYDTTGKLIKSGVKDAPPTVMMSN
jgi:antitoxin component YwqK of YwqJK toxin-antitoxin module